MKNEQGPKILLKLENLLIEVMICLRKYPKAERYTLGEKTELTLLLGSENIFYAAFNANNRLEKLREARVQFQMVKWLFRIAQRQNFLSAGHCEKLSLELIEVGKMVSTWIKTCESKNRNVPSL